MKIRADPTATIQNQQKILSKKNRKPNRPGFIDSKNKIPNPIYHNMNSIRNYRSEKFNELTKLEILKSDETTQGIENLRTFKQNRNQIVFLKENFKKKNEKGRSREIS